MALRWPFAEASEVMDAFQPFVTFRSDSPLRTLKRQRLVSSGIRVSIRDGGKLTGSVRVYSALAMDAARAERRNQGSLARRYAREAARLEGETESLVGSLSPDALTGHRPSRSSDRIAIGRIATLMAEALDALPPIEGIESTPGIVTFIDQGRVRVTSDESRIFDLPATMVSGLHLRPGDPVFITREDYQNNALVRVEAALTHETPSNDTDGDTDMSDYLATMLEGTDSPEYAERMHRLAAEQEPWLVTAEHIAG